MYFLIHKDKIVAESEDRADMNGLIHDYIHNVIEKTERIRYIDVYAMNADTVIVNYGNGADLLYVKTDLLFNDFLSGDRELQGDD